MQPLTTHTTPFFHAKASLVLLSSLNNLTRILRVRIGYGDGSTLHISSRSWVLATRSTFAVRGEGFIFSGIHSSPEYRTILCWRLARCHSSDAKIEESHVHNGLLGRGAEAHDVNSTELEFGHQVPWPQKNQYQNVVPSSDGTRGPDGPEV